MTAHAIFVRAARHMVNTCGEVVVFTGTDRIITTRAVISRRIDEFGMDARTGESRYAALLLVEDAGDIHRGDLLSDTQGRQWNMREEVENDGYVTTWSIDKA
jgi:hypothetical protein